MTTRTQTVQELPGNVTERLLTHPDGRECVGLAEGERCHGQQQDGDVNRQQQCWQSRHLPLLLMENGLLAACTATCRTQTVITLQKITYRIRIRSYVEMFLM